MSKPIIKAFHKCIDHVHEVSDYIPQVAKFRFNAYKDFTLKCSTNINNEICFKVYVVEKDKCDTCKYSKMFEGKVIKIFQLNEVKDEQK